MSSLFLIKGQWGSDVPGLEPSEGGQPQMLPDSELDPSSSPRESAWIGMRERS